MSAIPTSDNEGQSASAISPREVTETNENTTTSLLVDALKPTWQPNDIIKLFHEEREKISRRGRECRELLAQTNSVLKDALTLRDLYSYISPKTSQLHSESKLIIQEREDLRESFNKINHELTKKEQLRGIFKRMPEIESQAFSILSSVCQNYQMNEPSEQVAELIPLDEYYTKFFSECRKIKDLTEQLELCATSASTEGVYRYYVDIREQIMRPVFTKNLQKLVAKSDRNYCDLVQQACVSLVRLLRNEKQLFNQFFPTTKVALNELLDSLCKTFYEQLRPVVIHVNHLETLTELFKLVNETMRSEMFDECFQSTLNMLAEDIQERMVFRTEVFIQESILDYKPSRGDLAYPEKFELVPGGELRDYQSMWYPTVQRTVLALFYLNRVFGALTFRELAQELVTACYKSLDQAQHLVDELHGGSKNEASLFLSKHLAIIIDQLQSYGIDQALLPPPPPLDA